MGKRANSSFSFTFTNGVMEWKASDGRGVRYDLNGSPVYKTLDDFDRAVYDNGIKQKIADSAAIPADKETGHPAPVGEKVAAMQRVVDSLKAREWSAGRESPNVAFVSEVFRRAFPKKDANAIRTLVAGMKPEELAAIKSNPPEKLKAIVATINAERTAAITAGVDMVALNKKLDELMK